MMATHKRPKQVRAAHAARVRDWREKDRRRKAVTAALWGAAGRDADWMARLDRLVRHAERLEQDAGR